jgi:hypothetical protein
MARFRVRVDIGGTFTDFVLEDITPLTLGVYCDPELGLVMYQR